MVFKTNINNYIELVKFNKRSIKNRLKWIRKNYLKRKKNNIFFNLNKFFIFNNNYNFYYYFYLWGKKKRHWWRKIIFKKIFRENLNYGKLKPYKRIWFRSIRNFLKIKNKYTLYIRYFYTYKSLNFKQYI